MLNELKSIGSKHKLPIFFFKIATIMLKNGATTIEKNILYKYVYIIKRTNLENERIPIKAINTETTSIIASPIVEDPILLNQKYFPFVIIFHFEIR